MTILQANFPEKLNEILFKAMENRFQIKNNSTFYISKVVKFPSFNEVSVRKIDNIDK